MIPNIFLNIFKTPCAESRLYDSCIIFLSFKEIFFPIIIRNPIVKLIIPSPPSCINISIITFPNMLQYAYVGTTTRPVTQSDVVAVNNAVIKSVPFPLAEETGNINNIVPTKRATKKPLRIIKFVLNVAFIALSTFIFTPK